MFFPVAFGAGPCALPGGGFLIVPALTLVLGLPWWPPSSRAGKDEGCPTPVLKRSFAVLVLLIAAFVAAQAIIG